MKLKRFLKDVGDEDIVRIFLKGQPATGAFTLYSFKRSVEYKIFKTATVDYADEIPVPHGKVLNIYVKD